MPVDVNQDPHKFNPLLIKEDYTGGLNTKQRANKIQDNQLRSLISLDFAGNSLQRALGYSKVGTEADDTLTGKTLYTHLYLAASELLVKTIGQYIKFYDTVDSAWYKATATTFTSGLRWSFESFNSYLYGVNGSDWVFWNVATMTTIQAQITAASTVITLPTGKGALYPASGAVMIQNERITYTGVAGDTLTGCTITTTHASGSSIVLELDATTYSSLFNATQIKYFRGRLYGIDADTPTIIRHSKLADNVNPETDLVNFTVAGSGSGDAGYGIAPNKIMSINQFVIGNPLSTNLTAVLASFCKDGIIYNFLVTDGASTTTNAYTPMRICGVYPAAFQLVTRTENDLSFVDQFGHVRTLSYSNDVNTPVNVQTISTFIEPSLELMTFTGGQMRYWKRKLYVTGQTPNAGTPDMTFYHDSTYNAWGAYKHWDVVDTTEYNGRLYGLSTVTGNVWLLEDGYDANGGPYYSESISRDEDFGVPLLYKSALKLRFSGFITQNCNVYIDLYFDNRETPITFLLNGDNTSIVGLQPNVSAGSVIFGSGVFGGGLIAGSNRRSFTAQLLLNSIQSFFKVAIKTRIDDLNVDYETLDMNVWARVEGKELWLSSQSLNVN